MQPTEILNSAMAVGHVRNGVLIEDPKPGRPLSVDKWLQEFEGRRVRLTLEAIPDVP